MTSDCTICAYAEVHFAWPPGMSGTHCKDCHRTWTGLREIHCVQCHNHFSGVDALERHQPVGLRCLDLSSGALRNDMDPNAASLRATDGPYGITWRRAEESDFSWLQKPKAVDRVEA